MKADILADRLSTLTDGENVGWTPSHPPVCAVPKLFAKTGSPFSGVVVDPVEKEEEGT